MKQTRRRNKANLLKASLTLMAMNANFQPPKEAHPAPAEKPLDPEAMSAAEAKRLRKQAKRLRNQPC